MTTLDVKVRFLSNPSIYPRVTTRIEAKETHMSWVFLAEDRVYKLKKPVKYPFLDFSTLARRRFYCEEEIRLNRRLAGGTYLGAIPLRFGPMGGLSLSGQGRIVDWLVEMKRLSHSDMLDTRLFETRVTKEDVRDIGNLMARFYKGSAPEIAGGDLYLKHLLTEQAINRSVLQRPDLGVGDSAMPVLDAVDEALEVLAPTIGRRIADGLVVEGHGDLRPEHVHLGRPVQVIDCLEFNRAMRIIDPYDEINYLGLECAMLGAPWIRQILLDTLATTLGNLPGRRVMSLYGGFRALLRARLCIAHLFERPVRHPEKWTPLALAYIALAKQEVSFPCQSSRKSTYSHGDV